MFKYTYVEGDSFLKAEQDLDFTEWDNYLSNLTNLDNRIFKKSEIGWLQFIAEDANIIEEIKN